MMIIRINDNVDIKIKTHGQLLPINQDIKISRMENRRRYLYTNQNELLYLFDFGIVCKYEYELDGNVVTYDPSIDNSFEEFINIINEFIGEYNERQR